MGAIIFYPVTLTLEFDPFLKNFNLANNFWTVSPRALIFHMSILCDKTFPLVPLFFTLWPWTWSMTHFFKTLTLLNNFWSVSARALIFHMSIPCVKNFLWFYYFLINIRAFKLQMSISCDKIFLLVSRYLSLWPWPSLELAFIRGICVSQTHVVFIDIPVVVNVLISATFTLNTENGENYLWFKFLKIHFIGNRKFWTKHPSISNQYMIKFASNLPRKVQTWDMVKY